MPYTLSQASSELLPPELGGERVVGCVPHIGYLHSGFEKLGEHLNYNQYVTIVDRMDYSAPIYNELAWHGATEKLMGIEITPRCNCLLYTSPSPRDRRKCRM